MRRLLRISVEGFKTFAGRIDLELGPGMTAVVGPNGSGKSNLVDALAWAVGSRSWKSLRGDGMEDVLFHGGERQAAAPFARVTASFANEDRLLGIDFSEVTVSREIHRGGGSRVLLNGAEARLKDAQAVLSGTGLAGGFSLIRQGAVDRLVLSPPEDVGRWVEESANLAAYRTRKQQAIDRLRKVEAHAAEAERTAAALRRELHHVRERAARARRRRELEERRAFLARSLRTLERSRILDALAAVESESVLLRRELQAFSARRIERAADRRRLEEDLQGPEAIDSAGAAPLADVEGRVQRIRGAGGDLESIARQLSQQGPGGWPSAADGLDRVAAVIREIRRPGSRGSSPPEWSSMHASRFAELRRTTVELEELDRESAERSTALSARDCEGARLEERLAALGTPEESDPPIVSDLDPVRARGELEDLARELALTGPVDETAEQRERGVLDELAALTPVLQDLGATRAQLAGFLRQMEQITARLFDQTRAAVEERFRNYCAVLFQGGEARLLPLEREHAAPADPLGTAPPELEVRVKLPRKPETSLALLSGGERSLAGLALILALAGGAQRECGRLLILDEVDAALDEANAARLALLLRELQREHQILCVTHNRLTMHQAARLVGVTFGTNGASTLVHVELERLERNGSAA